MRRQSGLIILYFVQHIGPACTQEIPAQSLHTLTDTATQPVQLTHPTYIVLE
jgi:hypothetical protein